MPDTSGDTPVFSADFLGEKTRNLQENYATLLGNPFSLYAIPKDSVTPDMAGAVLECMASESYRIVQNSSAKMIDKIQKN